MQAQFGLLKATLNKGDLEVIACTGKGEWAWRSLSSMLLLAILSFLVAGCNIPPKSEWPRITLLTTPECAFLAAPGTLERFAYYDGTVVILQFESLSSIKRMLAEGTDAEMVLIEDAELWQEALAKGWVADEPWRFSFTHDQERFVGAFHEHQGQVERIVNRPPSPRVWFYAGAVLPEAEDPRAARRLWNYLEKRIRHMAIHGQIDQGDFVI